MARIPNRPSDHASFVCIFIPRIIPLTCNCYLILLEPVVCIIPVVIFEPSGSLFAQLPILYHLSAFLARGLEDFCGPSQNTPILFSTLGHYCCLGEFTCWSWQLSPQIHRFWTSSYPDSLSSLELICSFPFCYLSLNVCQSLLPSFPILSHSVMRLPSVLLVLALCSCLYVLVLPSVTFHPGRSKCLVSPSADWPFSIVIRPAYWSLMWLFSKPSSSPHFRCCLIDAWSRIAVCCGRIHPWFWGMLMHPIWFIFWWNTLITHCVI